MGITNIPVNSLPPIERQGAAMLDLYKVEIIGLEDGKTNQQPFYKMLRRISQSDGMF